MKYEFEKKSWTGSFEFCKIEIEILRWHYCWLSLGHVSRMCQSQSCVNSASRDTWYQHVDICPWTQSQLPLCQRRLSSRITYCTRGLILVSFMNAQSYGFIIVFTHVLVFAYMYSTSNCINRIHRVGICTGRNCILVEYPSCAPTIISPVRPVKHQHESNGKYLLIQRFKVIAIAI